MMVHTGQRPAAGGWARAQGVRPRAPIIKDHYVNSQFFAFFGCFDCPFMSEIIGVYNSPCAKLGVIGVFVWVEFYIISFAVDIAVFS